MLSKGAGLGLILASENVSPLGCFVGEGVLADFCVIQKWSRVEILHVLLGLDNVAPRNLPGNLDLSTGALASVQVKRSPLCQNSRDVSHQEELESSFLSNPLARSKQLRPYWEDS